MKLWPFGKKVEEKHVFTPSTTTVELLSFGLNGAENPSSAVKLYKDSSAVSVPINWISSLFSGISPVLKTGDDFITDHPLLDLLNRPSSYYSAVDFRDFLARYFLITGEVELIALGNVNGPPLELQPISPTKVSMVQTNDGLPGSVIVSGLTLAGDYRLDQRTARYFDGNLRELKVIKDFSTLDNSLLRGQSVLVSAAQEARQHILGNKHNVSLLENGGRLSLVFHYEEDLELDDFEELKKRIREQYGGSSNTGKIAISSGGKMKVEEFGKTNKDMDFAELQKVARESVALSYKFPLPLLSTDASTFNNYREAKLALYDDAVLPLADKIYAAIGDFLLPRFKLDPSKYKITYDILSIPALRYRTLDEVEKRKNIGIESDNELRNLISREPYQGGDTILKPATLIPAGTDLITEEPTPTLARGPQDE